MNSYAVTNVRVDHVRGNFDGGLLLPLGLHGRTVDEINRFTGDFANASIRVALGVLLVVHGGLLVHFRRNFRVTRSSKLLPLALKKKQNTR